MAAGPTPPDGGDGDDEQQVAQHRVLEADRLAYLREHDGHRREAGRGDEHAGRVAPP